MCSGPAPAEVLGIRAVYGCTNHCAVITDDSCTCSHQDLGTGGAYWEMVRPGPSRNESLLQIPRVEVIMNPCKNEQQVAEPLEGPESPQWASR